MRTLVLLLLSVVILLALAGIASAADTLSSTMSRYGNESTPPVAVDNQAHIISPTATDSGFAPLRLEVSTIVTPTATLTPTLTLQTGRVIPGYDRDTMEFTLWFIAPDDKARDLKIVLSDLVKGDGTSILPGTRVITKEVSWTPPLMEKRFQLTFPPQTILNQGTYTGTLTIMAGDSMKSFTFNLVLPQRELAISDQRDQGANPQVRLAFTRILPLSILPDALNDHNLLSVNFEFPLGLPRASDRLLIYEKEGAGPVRAISIPPAKVTNKAGAMGIVAFTPDAQAIGSDHPVLTVDITAKGIRGTGLYTGTTTLRSLDLSSSRTLEVTLSVTDFFLWPLLVIVLGVVFSNWMASRVDLEKNSEYQRLLIEQVRQEALKLRAGVAERPEYIKSVETQVLELLDEATESLNLGDFGRAATKRTQAEEELKELRLLYAIHSLERETTDYRNGDPEPDQPKAKEVYQKLYQQLQAMMEEARNKITEGKITESQTKLDEVKGLFQDYKAHFREARERIEEAEKSIDENEPGWGALKEAKEHFESLRFRQAFEMAVRALQQKKEGKVERKEITLTIDCITDKRFHFAGEPLEFVVTPSRGELGQEREEYTWHFNGQEKKTKEPRCSHIFPIRDHGSADKKEYTVKIDAKLPGEPIPRAELPVTLYKPNFTVHCEEADAERRVAGIPLTFKILRVSQQRDQVASEADFTFDWSVDLNAQSISQAENQGPVWQFTFKERGDYIVKAMLQLKRKEQVTTESEQVTYEAKDTFRIKPSPFTQARADYQRSRRLTAAGVSIFAGVVGLVYIQFFQTAFGSLQEYVLAFLWGAGVDHLNRGFPTTATQVFEKIQGLFKRSPQPAG